MRNAWALSTAENPTTENPTNEKRTTAMPDQDTGPNDQAGPDVEELLREAQDAREVAYAPYSKFDSGAAVRTDTGEVVTGAIIENISLGLAMCAERVALFGCIANGQRPTHLALRAPQTDGGLTMPCGACLQVALELGGPDLVVAAEGENGERMVATVGELLPHGPHRDRS